VVGAHDVPVEFMPADAEQGDLPPLAFYDCRSGEQGDGYYVNWTKVMPLYLFPWVHVYLAELNKVVA
jgi:hypothetical protein